MTPQHPQRCETCSHYGGHICYQQHNRMSDIELTLIEMVGCASHSAAPATAAIKLRMPGDLEEFWLREHDAAIRKDERKQVLGAIIPALGLAIQTDISDTDYVMIEDLESVLDFLRSKGQEQP